MKEIKIIENCDGSISTVCVKGNNISDVDALGLLCYGKIIIEQKILLARAKDFKEETKKKKREQVKEIEEMKAK